MVGGGADGKREKRPTKGTSWLEKETHRETGGERKREKGTEEEKSERVREREG